MLKYQQELLYDLSCRFLSDEHKKNKDKDGIVMRVYNVGVLPCK